MFKNIIQKNNNHYRFKVFDSDVWNYATGFGEGFECDDETVCCYDMDVNTLCAFSGLRDSDYTCIYTGDIIQACKNGKEIIGVARDTGFYFGCGEPEETLSNFDFAFVIGNLHDADQKMYDMLVEKNVVPEFKTQTERLEFKTKTVLGLFKEIANARNNLTWFENSLLEDIDKAKEALFEIKDVLQELVSVIRER